MLVVKFSEIPDQEGTEDKDRELHISTKKGTIWNSSGIYFVVPIFSLF